MSVQTDVTPRQPILSKEAYRPLPKIELRAPEIFLKALERAPDTFPRASERARSETLIAVVQFSTGRGLR